MKKLIPIFLILLFAATTNAFSMHIPSGNFNVPTLGSRDVIISLASDKMETISLNLIDSKPWMNLQPPQVVRLEPDTPAEAILTLSPFEDSYSPYFYPVTIIAESLTGNQTARATLYISVYKGEVIDIEKIVVSGDTKPLGDIKVSVIVKNYKTITENDVVVNAIIYSPSKKVFEFRDVLENINPDERASVNKTFNLGKYAESGLYKVIATMTAGNESRDATQTFNVAARAIIVTTSTRTPLMFGFSKEITVTNDGNEVESLYTITEPITALEGMFYSGYLPTNTQGGNYIYNLINIAPGQIIAISYSVDYTSLFMFIIALIIIFWVIFFKLRTVRIKKYIIQKKELEEGEEFTVGIEVKNASGKKIDEITITDFVPPIFELKEDHSLSPTKKKSAAGTEISWKLKDVHPKEERLVSYKIIPLFGVHGQIRLPRASVIYKQAKREVQNRSTFATIGIATEKEGEHRKKRK